MKIRERILRKIFPDMYRDVDEINRLNDSIQSKLEEIDKLLKNQKEQDGMRQV